MGAEADLVLLDLETERTVSPERFRSKGKNTPFAGERLKGFPVMTLVKGEIVFKEDTAHA